MYSEHISSSQNEKKKLKLLSESNSLQVIDTKLLRIYAVYINYTAGVYKY